MLVCNFALQQIHFNAKKLTFLLRICSTQIIIFKGYLSRKYFMRPLLNNSFFSLWLIASMFFTPLSGFALTYPLLPSTDIVGEVHTAAIRTNQSLLDLGLRYNLGYYEILEANPELHPKLAKPGTEVTMATQFILPDTLREGVVVNLAELRLYLYPEGGKQVITLPVGIGKYGWDTPIGEAEIIDKRKNPKWYVPEGVYLDMKKRGVIIPRIWPAGPKNPLGKYAMRLSIPGYDIHGTNRNDGVGRRSSAGCIRMLNEDVAEVYANVEVGTKVTIVNQPFKIGVDSQHVFLEAHMPLYEKSTAIQKHDFFPDAKAVVEAFLKTHKNATIDWSQVKLAVQNFSGIPFQIGQV